MVGAIRGYNTMLLCAGLCVFTLYCSRMLMGATVQTLVYIKIIVQDVCNYSLKKNVIGSAA